MSRRFDLAAMLKRTSREFSEKVQSELDVCKHQMSLADLSRRVWQRSWLLGSIASTLLVCLQLLTALLFMADLIIMIPLSIFLSKGRRRAILQEHRWAFVEWFKYLQQPGSDVNDVKTTLAFIHRSSCDPRIDVRIRFIVQNLSEINTARHTFKAELVLEATWVDHTAMLQRRQLGGFNGQQTLMGMLERGLNNGELRDAVWLPGLTFSNVVGDLQTKERWYKVYPASSRGSVVIAERHRIIGEFAEEFELHNFPVDRQTLTVRVRAKDPVGMVHLSKPSNHKYSSAVVTETFVHDSEWMLSKHVHLLVGETPKVGSLEVPAKVYPELHLQIVTAATDLNTA